MTQVEKCFWGCCNCLKEYMLTRGSSCGQTDTYICPRQSHAAAGLLHLMKTTDPVTISTMSLGSQPAPYCVIEPVLLDPHTGITKTTSPHHILTAVCEKYYWYLCQKNDEFLKERQVNSAYRWRVRLSVWVSTITRLGMVPDLTCGQECLRCSRGTSPLGSQLQTASEKRKFRVKIQPITVPSALLQLVYHWVGLKKITQPRLFLSG